ncbi:MAG: hypothetical protein M1482_02315 [Chloroflexi bacterium]|nr:hypothetical protein [Chloroflexota bacterium]
MKWLPTAIAIGVGIVVLLNFFFTQPLLDAISFVFREWTIILTAFAVLLGLLNLVQVHVLRIIKRNEPNTGYSILVLVTALSVFLIGLLFGLPSAPMNWVFDNMYLPLQGAFFALVAFFLATAAYRALRARSIETTWMLVAALVVLVGQAPLVNVMTQAKEWVLNVPSTAGTRGILLGVALGTIATGLRLIIGLDRPYSE